MSIKIEAEHGVGKVLLEWWRALDDDRASRAVLRRAPSVTAVTLTAPYQRLYRRLLVSGWQESARHEQEDRLAAVVGLLAHVEQNDERKLAQTMSEKSGERPAVSELRFRRLLESPDLDTLFTGFRRVLPLMRHRANVLALSHDVLFWGDSVKKSWAYEYEWP